MGLRKEYESETQKPDSNDGTNNIGMDRDLYFCIMFFFLARELSFNLLFVLNTFSYLPCYLPKCVVILDILSFNLGICASIIINQIFWSFISLYCYFSQIPHICMYHCTSYYVLCILPIHPPLYSW